MFCKKLNTNYLETLSIGEHEFRVMWKDENADMKFTMVGPAVNLGSLPQTGDNERAVGYLEMVMPTNVVFRMMTEKSKKENASRFNALKRSVS